MKIVKPLQLQAYEVLKSMILDGKLEPKTIYSETRVSKELGISRTPMRDAIQCLSQERYLDVIPSKGFCLHEMTQQDLIETYQIRCALEGFCVVQLAKDFELPESKPILARLEELLKAQETVIRTTHSIEEFAAYDQSFHECIVHSLHNSVISDTFDNYHYQMSRQATLSLELPGRMEQTLEEHMMIFHSIKLGAVGGSYKATLTHLEKPKGIIHLAEK